MCTLLDTTSSLRLPLYVAHLPNHRANINKQNNVGRLNSILILLPIAQVGLLIRSGGRLYSTPRQLLDLVIIRMLHILLPSLFEELLIVLIDAEMEIVYRYLIPRWYTWSPWYVAHFLNDGANNIAQNSVGHLNGCLWKQ